jgi:hypothetical protein
MVKLLVLPAAPPTNITSILGSRQITFGRPFAWPRLRAPLYKCEIGKYDPQSLPLRLRRRRPCVLYALCFPTLTNRDKQNEAVDLPAPEAWETRNKKPKNSAESVSTFSLTCGSPNRGAPH